MEKKHPIRKNIRLPDYDYSEPGYYFITVCTHKRQNLFDPFVGAHLCVRPPENCSFIVKWLYELEQKYSGISIDCCAVMPDHIHFVLIITGAHAGAPLPEMIKWFKTQTTNECIRLVKSGLFPGFQGHVWQRGYFDHIIRNDADLAETRQYIRNNPLNWILNKE